MPVIVTGADQPLGRAVVLELAGRGGEVRATVRSRSAAGALRAIGVRVSVGDLSDPLRLGAALEDAHTVLHLDRGPDGHGSPGDTWEWLIEAAQDTGVRRIVTVLPQGDIRTRPPACELVVLRISSQSPDRPGYPDAALVRRLVEADLRGE